MGMIPDWNVRGNVDLKLNDYIRTYVDISTIFSSDKTGNGDYWSAASSANRINSSH